ncbi:granulin, putative, partial [Ixodes scapularis]
TCCKLKGGKYTCCPLPNAVCCPDKEHCCPQGYSCDNETDACKPSASSVQPLLQAFANTRTKENYVAGRATKIVCPDGKFKCPDGYTCCKAPDSSWSCCPLKNAVCCDDHIHCCPEGSVCNTSRGKCQSKVNGSLPWSLKVKAIPIL